jgi:hypothetical protein
MFDNFFEFRPTFPIAGQLLPKRSGNRNFRPTLSKAGLTRSEESLVDRVYVILRNQIPRIRGSFGRYIRGGVHV